MLVMKAPASRDRGERKVRCNEAQASILRKVGWTEVHTEVASSESDEPAKSLTMILPEGGSPPDVTILEPETVEDPDSVRVIEGEVRPKRKYSRRVVSVEPDGSVRYKAKPKRQYRRRDLTAEE